MISMEEFDAIQPGDVVYIETADVEGKCGDTVVNPYRVKRKGMYSLSVEGMEGFWTRSSIVKVQHDESRLGL